MAQLYVDMFDTVEADYANQMEQLMRTTEMAQKNMELATTKGYLENAGVYQTMIANQQAGIKLLKEELDDLSKQFSKAMSSGQITEYSEAWYDLKAEINSVEDALADANIQLEEYYNGMRKVSWDAFDYAQDRFKQLSQESNFLIAVMQNDKLFDDRGQFSKEGAATAAMRAVNFNAYMKQADEYAKEMRNVERELTKDPYDKELIARREALLALQQESIQAAESEKGAIKELVSQGIQLELEALKKLIDEYNESMDSAKDLYEYQKKVSAQSADIASLEKQLAAYQNDTSEENRARVQQLRKNLKEAEDALSETEYDKSISDQKQLLSDLYDEYSELLNERLDNVDLLMEDMINGTNANLHDIRSTIETVSSEVGYNVTDAMHTALSTSVANYDRVFEGFSSVTLVLTDIYNLVNSILGASSATNAYSGGLASYTGSAVPVAVPASSASQLSPSVITAIMDASQQAVVPSSPTPISSQAINSGRVTSIGSFNVSIPIERVQDYNDMVSQMQRDPKFEKLISAMTLDRVVGKSSIGKNSIQFG